MKKYIIILAILIINCQFTKAQSWLLSGNAGTAACTDFIGTTDATALCFKVNSTTRMKISTGGNLAIGNFTAGYKLDVNGDINFNEANVLRIEGVPVLKADHSDNSIYGGQDAGNSITLGSGIQNTAFGYQSLYSTAIGDANSAFGWKSLYANTDGIDNTAVGHAALLANSTGSGNTGIGEEALSGISTQDGNTGVGYLAGYFNTATNCTFVGAATQTNANGYTNSSAFGYGTLLDGSNRIYLGNSSITSIKGQVGFTTYSDGRFKKNIIENVPGLSFINKLRPITYNVDVNGMENFMHPNSNQPINHEKEKIIYSGFIAQEVEKSAKELNYDFSGVDKPENENGLYGLRYAEFVVPITKAIQELDALLKEKDAKLLSQQIQIDELKTMVNQLKNDYRGSSGGIEKVSIGLRQNQPNPFSEKTTINFILPTDANQGMINIYSMNGKEIANYLVDIKSSSIEISAKTFSPGNYIYKLIINEKVIDSKIMTITR
jgi:hypothetical protein